MKKVGEVLDNIHMALRCLECAIVADSILKNTESAHDVVRAVSSITDAVVELSSAVVN